jgi:hypothetical protein
VSTTKRTRDAEREQPERRPPPDVLVILAIKRRGIPVRRGGCRVTLGSSRPAAALAPPAHRLTLAPEAVPVAEELAAHH